MVCIKRQRSSYTDILTENLIWNGLHLEEQKRRGRQAQKKKGKNPEKKITRTPRTCLLVLGKSNAELWNLLLFTVINTWGLITPSSKSPIPCRVIVLYALVIKTLPTKINMYFTVIKQELILYFFTSSHLLWHWMVMCSGEHFNPRKIRLEN